jgi:hypothetical protein
MVAARWKEATALKRREAYMQEVRGAVAAVWMVQWRFGRRDSE